MVVALLHYLLMNSDGNFAVKGLLLSQAAAGKPGPHDLEPHPQPRARPAPEDVEPPDRGGSSRQVGGAVGRYVAGAGADPGDIGEFEEVGGIALDGCPSGTW